MELDRRKQSLLQAIVVTYVERAEPVGSQWLAEQQNLGVRSATIRNELAEMTDLGYLRQPHTSAGRVPSDRGYRYYVDRIMAWDPLSRAGAKSVRASLAVHEGDVEQLLQQTCRILSSLTRYTSVATPPQGPTPRVHEVYVTQLDRQRLLAVVILDNGRVIHRFADPTRPLTPSEAVRVGNALDSALKDRGVQLLPEVLAPAEQLGALDAVVAQLYQTIRAAVEDECEGELYLTGASRILEQPEFREANRVEPLIRLLEERKSAYLTLRSVLREERLAVSIGRENTHEALHEVSLVAARYSAGADRHGWVGVLGPTRMQYESAVSAVEFVARTLTQTLSRFEGS